MLSRLHSHYPELVTGQVVEVVLEMAWEVDPGDRKVHHLEVGLREEFQEEEAPEEAVQRAWAHIVSLMQPSNRLCTIHFVMEYLPLINSSGQTKPLWVPAKVNR